MQNKFEHVIWDWNGTLLNDVNLCLELLNDILKSKSARIMNLEEYREKLKHPLIDFYRDIFGQINEDDFSVFSHDFHREYLSRRSTCNLHPESESTLKKIKNSQIEQSILSAHPHEMLVEIVSHFKLSDYFKNVCGAGDHLAGSKVEKGLSLIEESGISPTSAVVIGDTDHDAEVAKAMGASCILVADGFQSRARLERCNVPVVNSLSEAWGILGLA